VFCTVVERQSFTRAADELCLTQPAVSAHIRALEQLLGASLFDRRRRGAQLTEAGRCAHEYALAVLRGAAALTAQLRDLAGGEAGEVALGVPITLGTYVLPGLLARFQRRHPAARLSMRILAPQAIQDMVLRGDVDFGIVSEIIPLAGSLRAELLWPEPAVLVAPPDHRLVGRPYVEAAELAGEPFILGPARFAGDRALDSALERAGLAPRRIVLEVGNPEGGKQAVLAGCGLVILPRRVVAAELADGWLVALACPDIPPIEQFYLIYRQTHRFSPLAQELMTYLRAELSER